MRNESEFDLYQLPMHLQDLIEDELDESETIVWMDQPIPAYFIIRSLPIAFSGLIDVCIAIGLYLFFKPPLFIVIPILLFGLAFLCIPLWSIKKISRTVYLLSDQRAIIFQGGRFMQIQSYLPAQLDDIQREQKKDGSGSLIFEKIMSKYNNNQFVMIGFRGIKNVKEVHDMIEKLIARFSSNQSSK